MIQYQAGGRMTNHELVNIALRMSDGYGEKKLSKTRVKVRGQILF
jgi:hypothetical protein